MVGLILAWAHGNNSSLVLNTFSWLWDKLTFFQRAQNLQGTACLAWLAGLVGNVALMRSRFHSHLAHLALKVKNSSLATGCMSNTA